MIINLYSVYDSKLKAYGRPFCSPNDDVAERSFQHIVNSPDHAIHQSPADYTLFRVGSFNDDDASIEASVPVVLGNAIQYVVKPEPIQMPEYNGEN